MGKNGVKKKIPHHPKKTVEGSLAFFTVGLAVAFTQVSFIPALLGAFFGSLTEAYSPVDDNIPIPLISALIMSAAVYFL